jgi:hypothetical protein
MEIVILAICVAVVLFVLFLAWAIGGRASAADDERMY